MQKRVLTIHTGAESSTELPLTQVHSLVIGSGAAGLNAAVQLVENGITDVLILTEGLSMGTSINTGSDKQTYYKLSVCGTDTDSPRSMADTYFANGSMHGDLALVEASLSIRAFMHLVNLGVPFPRDSYGQFVGYKTDHDPRQRATSIGPYTSREMCRKLIARVKQLKIGLREGVNVVELITTGGDQPRVAGALALNKSGRLEAFLAENIIFAVGGPGGIYKTSVYPQVHSGAIGLALMAGARAANLPESQYGLASTKFRWNVSGTYMQVIPRVISRAANGISDEREFMPPYFNSLGEMNGMVFLKGYQWPFDARKVMGGSSIVDILVYQETVINGRRVYLDFRRNPDGFKFEDLPGEAHQYLVRSEALQDTPIQRLQKMNPGAVQLYAEHAIDLTAEALEVAVCAQHNNGGLAGNIWYESTNIKHLFPVGEVNGSHGVARPGGSALNAGQVAGFRAAEFIANRYAGWTLDENAAVNSISDAALQALGWMERCREARTSWQDELQVVQERMSRVGSHIRSLTGLETEVPAAWQQVQAIHLNGCKPDHPKDMTSAFRVRQLCFTQAAYLDAIQFQLKSGVGSRGSAVIVNPGGQKIHPLLDESWKIDSEDTSFRGKVLESCYQPDGSACHEWAPCRSIPEIESWFETTWAKYRSGEIYQSG